MTLLPFDNVVARLELPIRIKVEKWDLDYFEINFLE